MTRLLADVVAKAFKETSPANWTARAYLKNRTATGVFNACKFTYKNGMISILMDCDKPIGEGFQVKFHSFLGSFGDFCVAIQKAIYLILKALRDAELADVPETLSPNEIAFSVRKDGGVTYVAIVNQNGENRVGNELDYTDEYSQVDPDTSVDDLL